MEKQKHIFVCSLIFIAIICLTIMNIKYDRLSRYPYQEKEAREIIDKYLSDEEIEYIIEYSIAPNVFISFIDVDGFNIYHASEYKELSKLRWQNTPDEIVEMVEKTRDYIDIQTLDNYLYQYTFDEILYLLTNDDPYTDNMIICDNANEDIAYVDDNYSIGIKAPNNLETIDNNIIETSGNIELTHNANEALANMCKAMEHDEAFANSKCGDLMISKGYVSYSEQKLLYDKLQSSIDNVSGTIFAPGHDEHQLGLAFDVSVSGLDEVNFYKTNQYLWLHENAYKFGFIETLSEKNMNVTNKVAKPYQFRYVTKEMALKIHDQNITLKEALNK